MAKLLKLRRGTTSQHSSFTGAEGEVTVDTTKDTLVVHDGSTAGGTPLAKEAGTVAEATNVTVTANNSTNETVYPVFVDGATGTQGVESDTGLTYNPSTGDLTIGGELDAATGDFSGNVDIDGNIDIDGTCEADAYTVNGTALDAYVANITSTASGTSTHVTVTDNESTNENNLITFVEDAATSSGSHGLEMDGDFHYNPSTGLLSVPGVSTSGNITIAGNLTVNGTTTTVATTNTTITDNLLELNSGAGSNANDCGILIERGSTGDNAIIAWDESADRFTLGTTTATNDATGNISVSTGTLAANVVGNVTGNVTGNTSGSSGSCTGNAATATALATARTIGGSSFDGTANITVDAATLDGIDSAGFLRSDTSDVASEKITFSSNATNNYDDIATATTGQGGIEIYNQGVGNDAFMAFHSGSDYAVYFGLDADSNSLAVGGWSMGAVKHKIIHQGNVGSGDALSGLTVYTSAVHDSKGDLRTIPQNSKTSAYTLVAADAGKHITTNSGVTIPASVFSAGEAITIVNNSGSSITLTQGSSLTMYNTNDGNTGNRTLALRGMATILFTGATECHISGGGLT